MHVADSFVFCPRCGTSGLDRREGRSVRCHDCGFLYYFNAGTAAGAFIFHQDKLVLAVRAHDPGKGKLDLPGGFLEFDESCEAAVRREIFEELNIRVENLRYLVSAPNDYQYAGIDYKLCDIFFTCDAPDISTIRAQDDVADFVLLDPAELRVTDLAFSSAQAALQHLRTRLPG